MKANNMILNRFFGRNNIKSLIFDNSNAIYTECMKRYLVEKKEVTNKTVLKKLYQYLESNHRNEYFYKNTLFNKILLGKYSLNTTTALSEIPVGKSKADFILINGKATVFEIKTELDNLDRLSSQLEEYFKVFNYVVVVSCESNYSKLCSILNNTPVGIYILSKDNQFSRKMKKEPTKDNTKLNIKNMFKILNKSEYERILLKCFKKLPTATQINFYKECYKQFQTIPIEQAFEMMIEELKKRKPKEIGQCKKSPEEIASLVYFSKFNKNEFNKLNNFLKHFPGRN